MSTATLTSLIIALFDGIGSNLTPFSTSFTPATGFPTSNMADSELTHRLRTDNAAAGKSIVWDLGAVTEFNVFALMGTNATINTLGKLTLADDGTFTTGVVTSSFFTINRVTEGGGTGLTSVFNPNLGSMIEFVPLTGRTIIYVHPTTVTKRWMKWTQSDTGNPNGYLEWAVMRVGKAWQPAGGIQTFRSVPIFKGPVGAQKMLRGHEITIHNLSKDEAYDLHSMVGLTMNLRRMLIIPEGPASPTWRHDAIWGVLEGNYVREPNVGTDYSDKTYRVVLTFREVDR